MNFRLLTSPKNSSLSAAAIPNSWTESVSSVKWTLTRGHSLAVPSAGMCSVCTLQQAPGDQWRQCLVTLVSQSHTKGIVQVFFSQEIPCVSFLTAPSGHGHQETYNAITNGYSLQCSEIIV